MTEPRNRLLLEVSGLRIDYAGTHAHPRAVDGVSLEVRPGDRIGVAGESGSGKSTLGLALAGLLPGSARIVAGDIVFDGASVVAMSDRALRQLRGRQVAVVFQDAKTALDPVRTIGSQIVEAVLAHREVSREEAAGTALRLLREVELPEPDRRLRQYPHELSGGMRQRAMIAMALAGEPRLLVADEPTSALDVTTQAKIISLLARIGDERAMATILVTHDLGVMAGFAEQVLVMYAGAAVELGPVDQIFGRPAHPYTRALIESVPSLNRARRRRLRFIPGTLPRVSEQIGACRFEPRCPVGNGNERCLGAEPEPRPTAAGTVAACFFPDSRPLGLDDEVEGVSTGTADTSAVPDRDVLLRVDAVEKSFRISRGGGNAAARLRAVGGVSFEVRRGEAFGVVGESGSGKTTLARILVGLERGDSGRIELGGEVAAMTGRRHRAAWRPGEVQMIFQDPGDSLDPLLTVEQLVAEPLEIIHGGRVSHHRAAVAEALEAVGLGPVVLGRRASQLSGGQRQRVAIARSLTTKPRLLIADEAVASLDMSARGQILNLLADIQDATQLTCVHISHDLSLVRNICQRVAVMHAGRIVEIASADQLFGSPRHPYTAGLLSSIPIPDPRRERERERIAVVGDAPDLTKALSGCAYRTRCVNAQSRCAEEDPALTEDEPGHAFACHFPEPVPSGVSPAHAVAR